MSLDPKRIVEEEGTSPLAAMLRAARDDGLTQEELARIRAALATATIATGASATALVARETGILASLTAKLGVALAVVGVAAGGAWLARRDVATDAVPSEPRWDEATTASSGAPAHPSAANPPSDPGPSPSSRPEADAPAGPSPAKVTPRPSRPAPSTLTAPDASIAEPASPPAANPANEGALLLQARRALADDPVRALELVREHARQFPNSQLAPERARIEAEATKRDAR